MLLRSKLMVVAGAVAAAAAYGEFILDIRTPRASLIELHAITSSVSILMADYYQAIETMKKKYGVDAETALETRPPRLITRLGGKVVEENRAPGQFSDARGVFVIGPPGRVESTFPFEIDPRKAPDLGTVGRPGAEYLKSRFETELPARYLEFDDRDAVTDRCITISTADTGWLGRQLQFQSGTFCLVLWKGTSPASTLIGVALGDGDPWMRPFNRRICRWLTTVAIARLAAIDGKPPPNYAACVLVDRPNRSGAAETLQVHVYEVGRDATLAYVN